MRRARQQALDTRAKSTDAAERAFFLRGATRTSLDDITNKEAGVTRGADDLNARQAAAFIHAALSGYFRKRLMMPCASNDAEIGQIVAIALRCIDSESIGHAACIEP
jgi:hypothetical protein